MPTPRKTLKHVAGRNRRQEAAKEQSPTSAMPSRRRKSDRRHQNQTSRPLKPTAAVSVFTQVVRSFWAPNFNFFESKNMNPLTKPFCGVSMQADLQTLMPAGDDLKSIRVENFVSTEGSLWNWCLCKDGCFGNRSLAFLLCQPVYWFRGHLSKSRSPCSSLRVESSFLLISSFKSATASFTNLVANFWNRAFTQINSHWELLFFQSRVTLVTKLKLLFDISWWFQELSLESRKLVLPDDVHLVHLSRQNCLSRKKMQKLEHLEVSAKEMRKHTVTTVDEMIENNFTFFTKTGYKSIFKVWILWKGGKTFC